MIVARIKSLGKAELANAVGVAVMAGLTVAFIFGLLAPLALRDRQAAAQVEAATRQQQRASAIKSGIRTAREELDRARSRVAASPLQLQPVTALNGKLASMIGLASDCRLTLQDLRPGEAGHAKRYVAIPIRLTGSGRFPDLSRFLAQLHEQMPDVSLSSMKLLGSPQEETAAAGAELELRWIALPPDSTPAAVATVTTP